MLVELTNCSRGVVERSAERRGNELSKGEGIEIGGTPEEG